MSRKMTVNLRLWIIWIVIGGIFYYMNHIMIQYRHLLVFLALMAVISIIMIFAFINISRSETNISTKGLESDL